MSKMKECVHCGESILQESVKCCYCKELLDTEHEKLDVSIPAKNSRKSFLWAKLLMVLILIAGGVAFAFYENNAWILLADAQKYERNRSYNTATLGYKTVIEGFPFSYSTIKAKEGFRNVNRRADPKIANIRIKGLKWFDPYRSWAFPLVVSVFCGVVFTMIALARLFRWRSFFSELLLASISGMLFVFQIIDSGKVNVEYKELNMISYRVMEYPHIVFLGCYFLVTVCIIRIFLSPKR